MVLALDPRIPRVWRTPHSIQFGVDEPALVLDGVSAADERMLVALAAGVTVEGLPPVAERARAPAPPGAPRPRRGPRHCGGDPAGTTGAGAGPRAASARSSSRSSARRDRRVRPD